MTPKQRIRDEWERIFEDETEIDMPLVSDQIASILATDPDFCRDFTAAFLPDVVLDVGSNMIRVRRAHGRVAIGASVSTPQAVRESVRQEAEAQFAKWFEHVPSKKAQVKLMDMTKEELLEVSRTRYGAGMGEIQRAEWYRLIAGRMRPGQRTHEVWTEDELAALQQQIKVDVKTSIQPLKKQAA